MGTRYWAMARGKWTVEGEPARQALDELNTNAHDPSTSISRTPSPTLHEQPDHSLSRFALSFLCSTSAFSRDERTRRASPEEG